MYEASKCPICLETFNDEKHIKNIIPCGHQICQGCLDIMEKLECPICRKQFKKEDTFFEIKIQYSYRGCSECKFHAGWTHGRCHLCKKQLYWENKIGTFHAKTLSHHDDGSKIVRFNDKFLPCFPSEFSDKYTNGPVCICVGSSPGLVYLRGKDYYHIIQSKQDETNEPFFEWWLQKCDWNKCV